METRTIHLPAGWHGVCHAEVLFDVGEEYQNGVELSGVLLIPEHVMPTTYLANAQTIDIFDHLSLESLIEIEKKIAEILQEEAEDAEIEAGLARIAA